jgi:glutaminyl-peptide cyclotransferase
MKRKTGLTTLIIFFCLAGIGILFWTAFSTAPRSLTFDASRAFELVKYQVDLGPRIPGTEGHSKIIEWMVNELQKLGWSAEVTNDTLLGKPIKNVVAKKGSGLPWIILGAHYDTRMKADRDPDPARQALPVPGANDGASGVAVLLELARVMPSSKGETWLVFFDAEDQGDLQSWNWIMGSRAFANQLAGKPDAVVIVDMIGDANLNIYKEGTSTPILVNQIWSAAEKSGHADAFINQGKYRMIDDHTPFLEKGISAADIIDFDYPYWHTTADTIDKVSGESLKTVGDSLLVWLVGRQQLAK